MYGMTLALRKVSTILGFILLLQLSVFAHNCTALLASYHSFVSLYCYLELSLHADGNNQRVHTVAERSQLLSTADATFRVAGEGCMELNSMSYSN